MNIRPFLSALLIACSVVPQVLAHEPAPVDPPPHAAPPSAPAASPAPAPAAAGLLSATRQLTFDGKRSGEGYFSADGKRMILQSEREADNPFYQIYLLDLETGDTRRVSPGIGKTTCGWLHPGGQLVLFASTHADPNARQKMADELADRAKGTQRRYAWDYDPTYDLWARDLHTDHLTRLTTAHGYDAEGSYSPDGGLIAFASNRHAYPIEQLAEADRKRMEMDPSSLMDIYVMNSDGSDVRRLTDEGGYDGGPFFSADGKRICWRRFDLSGHVAEIWTMNIDGSDKRQLTRLGAMSWAPYFHPSGQYLIFTTNLHGFGNFELYLVDSAGQKQPVRVTDSAGFDGLPAFSPDGQTLTWTSNRTADKSSQIFLAQWNHDAALAALAAAPMTTPPATAPAAPASAPTTTVAAITAPDIRRHVEALASDKMAGRLTGTEGEILATQYVADAFQSIGLLPDGEGGFFQSFDFSAGMKLGDKNTLTLHAPDKATDFTLDQNWRPLSFSRTGPIDPTQIVFVGYGIVAPPADGQPEYDSYVHTSVKGKWVMMFRFLPDGITPERRQHLARFGGLRYKAMIARDKGAAGVIFVSGPSSKVKTQLVPLSSDTSMSGSSIAAVSITDDLARDWLASAGKEIAHLQQSLDTGELAMGFELPGLTLGGHIEIRQEMRKGRNVLGRLAAGEEPGRTMVVLGAHVDHLGTGKSSSSLAHDDEAAGIHYGADDNASGVAAMIEIARWLAAQKSAGKLKLSHDIVFAAWSGEELGILGSSHFVRSLHPEGSDDRTTDVIAYLNMDMIGRYRDGLTVHGLASSPAWAKAIERANVPVGLTLHALPDTYLPTDSTPFYVAGVPILSAFTGAHEDYHRPSDTPDKLNYEATARIAQFMGHLTRHISTSADRPAYVAVKRNQQPQIRGGIRAYLGTVPDYAQGDVKGLKLSGVAKGGPAEKAGLQAGDIITRLAGRTIENIYDYTYAIEALKVGQPVELQLQRGTESRTLTITPESRD